MIWPKNLAQIALNKALHHEEGREENVHGWRITRFRFFLICFGAMFLYYWLVVFYGLTPMLPMLYTC